MSQSMAYNTAAGLSGLLPAGTRHMENDSSSGSGHVVLRNIEACLQLCRMVRTSLGPQGRCKLVVNHLGKLIVTSDCASMVKDIAIEHPAAQLLAAACQKQEEQCGDATNFVLAFGGELLFATAKLIGKMTWTPGPEILQGYQTALRVCRDELLPALQLPTPLDVNQETDMLRLLHPVLASKQYGSHTTLAPLVAEACRIVSTRNASGMTKIPVSAVRTVKILGASVQQSRLVSGFVAPSGAITVTKSAKDCKVVVLACGFEASSTEAKGTVLMKTADDLLNYNTTEETKMHDIVQSIASTGVSVVVTGGNVSDMALHCLDRAGLVCVRLGSKWELRRLCQAVGATALVRLGPPTPDEMGLAESVEQQEVGGKTMTVFSTQESNIATIVLRASTHTVLNDLERAVDDGVHAVANAVKEGGAVVYGGGSVEMALSLRLQQLAAATPGLEQYALQAFAEALTIVPRTLAENAGRDAVTVLADLQALHSTALLAKDDDAAVCAMGVNIDAEATAAAATTAPMDDVVDLLSTKISALQLAVDAVVTILKIDQIIMSKPAGGPKP